QLISRELLACFYLGLGNVRVRNIVGPLWGEQDEEVMEEISYVNPIELIDRTGLRPGDLAMYVAYAGQDDYNIDAQVESFLYMARYRGLPVGVGYAPNGKHDITTAMHLVPGIIKWLGPLLAPYSRNLNCTSVQPAAACSPAPTPCPSCSGPPAGPAPCPSCSGPPAGSSGGASPPTRLPDLPTPAPK